MIDQYMMEHYETKYGMKKWQSPYFEYYHHVAADIEDDSKRRAFENAIFAAELVAIQQNYTVNEADAKKNREICLGIFLNLVRSGICSKQDIESGIANDIVDKLYDVYVSRESVTPRVDISPDCRVINERQV